MNYFRIALALVAAAAIFVGPCGHLACANLVSVEYFDVGSANPTTGGGPLWTGTVDTVSNNLRIDTWRELPGHGAEFWLPANLPIVWTARDASGAIFDVPDTFGPTLGGPVSIDNTWAFISREEATDMPWVDINGNSMTFGSIYPPTRVGWGGYSQIETVGGSHLFYPESDETTMPRLPVNSDSMIASTDALVQVIGRKLTDVPVIFAVPEPSAFLAVGLVGAVSAARSRRRARS